MTKYFTLVVIMAVLARLDAFTIFSHDRVGTLGSTSSSTRLEFFGGLKDAFANDDKLGKAQDPGLSSGPNYNENVMVNGKPVKGAVVGQKLTVVAGRVRVKIPVNCQKGDCGTCTVLLNGRKVKACQTPLPSGKSVIETL